MTAEDRIKAVEAGARAFKGLLGAVAAQRTLDEFKAEAAEDEADPLDYAALCELVATSFEANLVGAAPAHREGFLRALTCVLADGGTGAVGEWCVRPDRWDPLAETASSFDGARIRAEPRIDARTAQAAGN